MTRDDDLVIQLPDLVTQLPDEPDRERLTENEMIEIVKTMKDSRQVELHDRHVVVAQALLSQLHEGQASSSTNQGRRNRWGLARWR